MNPRKKECRPDEGRSVREHGQRRCQELDERAADTRAPDERKCPAAIDERVALDVLVLRDDGDEQRGVADGKQHAENADPERHPVQLPEREHPERVSDRDAGQQGGAAEIGADHGSAPSAAPVYPGARVQAEQQGRHPHEGGEIAHLGRGGIQREHADEGQGDR